MKKKVLFIDRDGTIVIEPPVRLSTRRFREVGVYPKAIRNLYFIRQKLDFEFAMVTNQDGWALRLSPKIRSGPCIIWC